jgi:hypothetical protein
VIDYECIMNVFLVRYILNVTSIICCPGINFTFFGGGICLLIYDPRPVLTYL